MKKTKVIIPALGILLLSTAASVTGTVAWFSTNQNVTADKMSISVQSGSSFLIIGTGNQDMAAIQGAHATSVDAINTNQSLFPAAHYTDGEVIGTGESAVTKSWKSSADADELNNWYTRYSYNPAYATPTDAQGGMSDKTNLTSFDAFVLVNEFRITVATGSNGVNNLKVKNVTIAPTDSGAAAANVVVATKAATASDGTTVVSNDTIQEFTSTGGPGSDSVILAAKVTDQNYVTVKVYIYWDGNNTNVNTNNIANLKKTDVKVEFTYGSVVQ